MNPSIRNLSALVLAVLAGTVLTVGAYVDSRRAPEGPLLRHVVALPSAVAEWTTAPCEVPRRTRCCPLGQRLELGANAPRERSCGTSAG